MLKFKEEDLANIINKRILPRLSKNGDDCWRWTGHVDRVGYGRLNIRRRKDGFCKNFYIHRLMFAFYKGNIPAKKEIHHTCYTRNCGNPDHLELKTRSQNMTDRYLKAGKGIEVDKF